MWWRVTEVRLLASKAFVPVKQVNSLLARHGGERVSEQGTLISADERGMAEVLSVYLLYWYKSEFVALLVQKYKY